MKRFRISVILSRIPVACAVIVSVMPVIAETARDSGRLSGERAVAACEEAMVRTDYVRARECGDILLAEGRKLNDARLTAFGNAYLGVLDVTGGRMEEGFRRLETARVWGEKSGNDTVLALSHNGLGIYWILSDNNIILGKKSFHGAAEHAARSGCFTIQFRVENNIIQTAVLQNDTTVIAFAEDCFRTALRHDATPVLSITARHIARLLILKGDYDAALDYLDEADRLQNSFEKDYISGLLLRGEIYINKMDLGEAEACYRKAMQYGPDEIDGAQIQFGLAKIKLARGEFVAAEAMAREALGRVRRLGVNAYDDTAWSIMESACSGRGDFKNAYEYSCMLRRSESEQHDLNVEYIQKEITTAMQVEKKEQEASYQRSLYELARRRTVLAIVFICLLVTVLVVLFRAIRKKNRLLRQYVRSIRESHNCERALEERIRQLESDVEAAGAGMGDGVGSRAEGVAVKDEVAEEIWTKVKNAMDSDGIYRRTDLTRDIFAQMIGTNRTYLSKVIREHTGKTYNAFINSYRIREAIDMLADPAKADYPLKAVSRDLGFSSISSFYTLFKAETGITPSSFRKNL